MANGDDGVTIWEESRPPKKGVKSAQRKEWKCGGKVKKMARGGGIEIRGKTRGKFV